MKMVIIKISLVLLALLIVNILFTWILASPSYDGLLMLPIAKKLQANGNAWNAMYHKGKNWRNEFNKIKKGLEIDDLTINNILDEFDYLIAKTDTSESFYFKESADGDGIINQTAFLLTYTRVNILNIYNALRHDDFVRAHGCSEKFLKTMEVFLMRVFMRRHFMQESEEPLRSLSTRNFRP